MAQLLASTDKTHSNRLNESHGLKNGLLSYFTSTSDPHRSLLVLRFALLNLFAFALLGVAFTHGYVHKVIAADQTYLSVVIFIVFTIGLVICTQKVWQTNAETDAINGPDGLRAPGVSHLVNAFVDADAQSRVNLSSSLRMRLSHRISVVRHLGNTLVLLGLIGTVLGFIIALSGVDPEKASAVESIAPMVTTLIQGMSTALYTTLIGSIFNVWLMANYQLLTSGTVNLISSLQDAVEKDA